MNCKMRLVIIISVMVMAIVAVSFSVEAQPGTVTKSFSKQEQDSAAAYWTRARINVAPALKMPTDMGPSGIDPAAVDQAATTGTAYTTPAGMASPGAEQIARTAYWRDWEAMEAELDNVDMSADIEGTFGVYTRFDVNGPSSALLPFWRIYPHIWDGKFTFTTPSGGASCSATVISGNNIVTAAHCVYDTPSRNQWYTNFAFAPAFRNGNAPYGTFATTACTILTAWINLSGSYSINTWARHDVAVCTLGLNSAGQTINQAVGWAGRLWNASNTQLVFNSGYPARIYTDSLIAAGPAQYLRACIAETFTQTTETLGSGCYWGRGISGGSWLVNYRPAIVSGNVNSVNSGLFIGQQNLYGARFNSSNIVPLCTARGC